MKISIMKFFIAAFGVFTIFTCTSAFIIPNDINSHRDGEIVRLEDVDGGIRGSPALIVRQRRLTCDFFSFESSIVTPNHAACALKCVRKGRGGGYCNGTTCVCRNDKWVPW